MLGVIINSICVIIGSIIGLCFKNIIPQRITDTLLKVVGLCVFYIGFTGSLVGQNVLILIFSMVFGVIIGEILDIDGKINTLGNKVNAKLSKNGEVNIAQGCIAASLLFCIGSMTLIGSFEAGVNGNHSILITKGILDLCSAIALSASLGIGVIFSSVVVFVSQGALVLLSGLIAPYMSSFVQNEMICTGSVIIIALSLNMMGITKFKVANLLPAVFLAPVFAIIYNLF